MHGFNSQYDLLLLRQRHEELRRHARASREFREAKGRNRFRSRHRRKRISS